MFTASKSPGLAWILLGFRWVCHSFRQAYTRCSLDHHLKPAETLGFIISTSCTTLHYSSPQMRKELLQLCKSAASPHSLPLGRAFFIPWSWVMGGGGTILFSHFCSLQALLTKFQALGCLPSTEFAVWFISFYSHFSGKDWLNLFFDNSRTPW